MVNSEVSIRNSFLAINPNGLPMTDNAEEQHIKPDIIIKINREGIKVYITISIPSLTPENTNFELYKTYIIVII